jgi:ABC-2 type transport system ATP-binding protein
MLVTLLRPTGGRATVAGYDVARDPAQVRRRIGVALQEAALDLLMTGRELIELQAVLHGIPPASVRQRASDLIERVGLADAEDRRVGTYSGGMRRRLDLAMALIHRPEVLFLDEPTTGLDPVSRLTLWAEVRRLRDEGTTVFLTTQYLEEADQLADRVGIISGGRIVAEGTPEALKAEVGSPHLDITLAGQTPDVERARAALERFGALRPPPAGAHLSVTVAQGAAAIAPVVRALDEAGIAVEGIELVRPTLDDVFVAKTGRHLEGAADAAAGVAAPALADAPA